MQRESMYCANERTQKKTELPRTLNRCVRPQKNERQKKQPVAHGIRNKKQKEEQEAQNTLIQKSGGKSCTRTFQQFQEYEYIALTVN